MVSRRSQHKRPANARREARQRPEQHGIIGIDAIAAGGDGVGRVEGNVMFVPRSAPGDRLEVAYVQHARFARGRVLQVLAPSPDRVQPRCHHFTDDRCGGCQLQHVSSDGQQQARRRIVQDALQRIAGRVAESPDLISGAQWEYRARLTLTLERHGRQWVGGLHTYDDARRIFALTECPISHPSLVDAWRAMAPLLHELPDTAMLRVSLRMTDDAHEGSTGDRVDAAPDGVIVLIEGGNDWRAEETFRARLMQTCSAVRGVLWQRTIERGDERGDERIVGRGDGRIVGRGDERANAATTDERSRSTPHRDDTLDALAFAQINPALSARLLDDVVRHVLEFAPHTVIDGYAGTGRLTARLADRGIRTTAIESDRAAIARATDRLAAHEGVTVVHATMEAGLGSALPADVVVLNPPRRGCDADVTALLNHSAAMARTADQARDVRAIIYVSCDPATLARDLGRLSAWRIHSLRCYDMFPQTAHVETVCVLIPENP